MIVPTGSKSSALYAATLMASCLASPDAALAQKGPIQIEELIYCSAAFEARARLLELHEADPHAIAAHRRKADILLSEADHLDPRFAVDGGMVIGNNRRNHTPLSHESDRRARVQDVLSDYANTGMTTGFPVTCMQDAICITCTDLLRVISK